LMRSKQLVELEPKLARLSIDFVVDHMGYVRPSEGGLDQPAFQALLRLIEGGRCWVKFTGAYRISKQIPLYADLHPFARALVKARPDRLLWGSDWPHAMSKGAEFEMPNTTDLFELLPEWGDEKVLQQILVDNPAKLFGF
jgi:predicted TIM-barrel fold metal-dependent hydrolase